MAQLIDSTMPMAQSVEVSTMAQPSLDSTMAHPLDSTMAQTISILTVPQPNLTQPFDVPVISLAQPLGVPTISQPLGVPTISQPLGVPTISQPLGVQAMAQPVADSTMAQPVIASTMAQPVIELTMAQPVADSTMAQPVTQSTMAQPVAQSTRAQPVPAQSKPLCLVCERQGTMTNHSLLLATGEEHLRKKVEYALGVTVTLVTSKHSALCDTCGGKLEQVGRLLKDLRFSYNATLEKYGVTSVTGLLSDCRLWSAKVDAGSCTQPTTISGHHKELAQHSDKGQPIKSGVTEGHKAAGSDAEDDTTALRCHGRGKNKKMETENEDLDRMECVRCNIVFTRRSKYRHHLKSHSSGSEHRCERCAEILPSIQALRVHQATRCCRSEVTPRTRSRSAGAPQTRSRSEAVAVTRSRAGASRSCQSKLQAVVVKSELVRGDVVKADGTEPQRRKRGRPRKHWPLPKEDVKDGCNDHFELQDSQDVTIESLCKEGDSSGGPESPDDNTSGLSEHETKPTDQRSEDVRHQCGVCGREFSHAGTLRRHMRIHSDHKPFTCDQCPAAFKWAQALAIHQRTHTGAKPFACPECPKTFRQLGTLRSHVSSHRGEKNYHCNICQSAFTRAMRLRIHMRLHTGERPYQCDRCGEGFADPQIYKKHVRLHTGEKPYRCIDCGAAFVMARYLTEHRKIHTGERRYLCAICGMAFANSGRLKRHSVTHTGIKAFKCNDCGRFFAHNSDLKIHQRIHSGEKPYLCPVCGKAFTHHAGMSQHLVVHTGEKKFACMMCEARFATRGKLKRHTLMHPKEQRFGAMGTPLPESHQLQGQPSSDLPQEEVIGPLPIVTNIEVHELSKDEDEPQETSMIIGAMESVEQSEEIVSDTIIPDFVSVLQTATPGEEYHVQAVLPPNGNVVFQGQPGEIQTLTLNFE